MGRLVAAKEKKQLHAPMACKRAKPLVNKRSLKGEMWEQSCMSSAGGSGRTGCQLHAAGGWSVGMNVSLTSQPLNPPSISSRTLPLVQRSTFRFSSTAELVQVLKISTSKKHPTRLDVIPMELADHHELSAHISRACSALHG